MNDHQRDIQKDQEQTSCFCFDLLGRLRSHVSRIRKCRKVLRKMEKGKAITKEEASHYLYVFGHAEPEPSQNISIPEPELKSNAESSHAGSFDKGDGNISIGNPHSIKWKEESQPSLRQEKSSIGDSPHVISVDKGDGNLSIGHPHTGNSTEEPQASIRQEKSSIGDSPHAISVDKGDVNLSIGHPHTGNSTEEPQTSIRQEKSSVGDSPHQGTLANGEAEKDTALPCHERPGRSLQDYTLWKVLGRGGFATIIMAEEKATKKTFALKMVDKSLIRSDKMVKFVQAEKKVFELASDSPFLVGMNSCFQTPTRLVFVIEFVCGGDMLYYMQRKRRLPENHAKFYSAEIGLGLNFLHNKGVVYRDLKFANILIDHEGHVKLTDYGLAKEGLGPTSHTRSFCGTPAYMAPEILVRIPYGFSVDWWSFGVILYGMMMGQLPYGVESEDTIQKKTEAVLKGPLKISTSLSATASSILIGLLKKNPCQRLGCHPQIGFEEIRSHPYYSDMDWVKLENRQITPPYKPPLKSHHDLENFNSEYTGDVQLSPDNSEAMDSNDQLKFQGFYYDWRVQETVTELIIDNNDVENG